MIDWITVLWGILILFASQVVQSTTGFGLGIVAMALLPLILPNYVMALCVVVIVAAISNVVLAIKYRARVNYELVIPLIVGYFISGFLSTQLLLVWQDEGILRRLVGVMIVLFSVFSLFFSKRIHMKPSPRNGVISGLLGGAIGGMFNMGGPPIVIFLLNATDENLEYIATIQFYFMLSNTYMIVIRLINGMFTLQSLYYSLFGLVGIVAGIFVGGKIFHKLNRNTMQKFVYIFMIAMGFWISIAG